MKKKPFFETPKSAWPLAVPPALIGIFAGLGGFSGQSTRNRMMLAVAAVAISILYGVLRSRYASFSLKWCLTQSRAVKEIGTAFYLAAFTVMVLGGLNYYQFNPRNLTEERNYDDITYYYLNSKYFQELGYRNFYTAMLIADKEGPYRFSHVTQYRNLHTYEMQPVGEAFKQTDKVKSRFTKERWAAFSHDINYISGIWKWGDWNYLFADHGYNPPPTWTLMGGTFASLCPVESIKVIASIDIVLVIAMFIAVKWAFGLDAFIFAFLFFVTTLSGQWPMAGQALLRFDWLAAAVIGWSLYKKEKYAASGAAFAYAGLVRIFPLVLLLPFAVSILRNLKEKRIVERKHLLLAAGAAATAVVLIGGATARYGTESFKESKEKMAMHAGPDSYSSQRVGLGDAMVFHGEVNRTEMNMRGGTLGKGEEIRNRMPYLYLLALGAVAFLVLFQLRSKEPEYLFVPLGILLIFILTTPQVNYLNIRILLFIWSVVRFRPRRSTVGLALLFFTEAWAQYCEMTYLRYNATSWSSVWLTVYFAFLVISNAKEVLGHRFGPEAGKNASEQMKRISPHTAMAGILALLSFPHFIYRGAETAATEPKPVALSALSQETKNGDQWDAPNHIILEELKGAVVSLPETSYHRRISVSLDGNDRCVLALYNDGTAIWSSRVGPRRERGKGMKVYRITLPPEIAKTGYDEVRIVPTMGDGAYSIGHLIFSD